MLRQRGRSRGGGHHKRGIHKEEGELVASHRESPDNVDFSTPFDSIEAQFRLLQHCIDQLSEARHLDDVDHISFFANILHNQGRILDRQDQQRLQACMEGFEAHIDHMESHIHYSFHRLADREIEVNNPIVENVPQ